MSRQKVFLSVLLSVNLPSKKINTSRKSNHFFLNLAVMHVQRNIHILQNQICLTFVSVIGNLQTEK